MFYFRQNLCVFIQAPRQYIEHFNPPQERPLFAAEVRYNIVILLPATRTQENRQCQKKKI